MRLALSDLAVQKLKFTGKQVRYWDTSLPSFGLVVSKNTKTFVVMRGKERRLVTLGRYPDLTLKRARTLAMSEMTQESHSGTCDAPRASQRFLEASEKVTKHVTHREYARYLKFLDFTGNVDDITLAQVRTKLEKLDGKPTAQNYCFATARAFLNFCVREGWREANPLARLPLPNKLRSRERVLTDDELKAIWKHTDTKPFGHIVRVLMLTGQRKTEIATLTDVTDVLNFPNTKNDQPHVIPVTPLVKEHLPIQKMNGWSKCKERLDKASGVTDWTLHDLRRTFASNCARLGVHVHVIEQILNHKSGSLTGVARIYNRYNYLPEKLDALLTHENFIRKLVGLEL